MEGRNRVLIGFGITLLIVGLVASFYQERTHYVSHGDICKLDETVTPYRDVGIVLAVAGIVFIALGFLNLSRRGFLVVGLVLLILGFFFFYWASRVNWDYLTTYNDEVNLAYPSYSSEYPQFGGWEYWGARYVTMQSGDFLTVSYPENIHINGTLMIVLIGVVEGNMNNTVLTFGYPFAYYTNGQASRIIIKVYLIAQNVQNVTLSTVTTLNHYETPQWCYFAIGVVLSLLAVIPIFKSNSKPKPITIEDSSQAERGI